MQRPSLAKEDHFTENVLLVPLAKISWLTTPFLMEMTKKSIANIVTNGNLLQLDIGEQVVPHGWTLNLIMFWGTLIKPFNNLIKTFYNHNYTYLEEACGQRTWTGDCIKNHKRKVFFLKIKMIPNAVLEIIGKILHSRKD